VSAVKQEESTASATRIRADQPPQRHYVRVMSLHEPAEMFCLLDVLSLRHVRADGQSLVRPTLSQAPLQTLGGLLLARTQDGQTVKLIINSGLTVVELRLVGAAAV
jgi:hypothetical protein